MFRTNIAVDNKHVEDDIMNLQSSTNERGVTEKCFHILRTLVPHLILEKHTGGPGIIGEDRIAADIYHWETRRVCSSR